MLKIQNFAQIDIDTVIIIAAIAIVAVGLICAIFAVISAVKNSNRPPKVKKTDAEEISADEYLEELEVRDQYLVLPRNVMYSVGNDGQIAAGKYNLKNTVDNGEAFNIRFNGLVREFQDDTNIVLAQGDTICCVSTSVMIKPL